MSQNCSGAQETGHLCKDGFHDYLVAGRKDAVGSHKGTKAAGIYRRTVAAGDSTTIRVRLSPGPPKPAPFADFDQIFSLRKSEADAFYAGLQGKVLDEDLRRIQRQAFAGILWSKQYFYYDVTEWLDGDPAEPKPPRSRLTGRNREWVHATMEDVVSMPDKWEFPWFAGWDWAFHLVTLAYLDLEDAKHQLILLGQSWYMHPNGQLPAYEWNFSDVNPPVQAWAALRLYDAERKRNGKGDRKFLERVFTKLLLNFTWWVNRKDPRGLNVFEGGFLGMDNIGVFDRSAPLPVDGMQVQSDGTSWMAMYSLNMLRIAIELAQEDDAYQDIATKFFEHFLMIGGAMTNLGGKGLSLWDDTDNFFYDWLVMSDGEATPLRVRSLVGLIPMFAVEVADVALLKNLPSFTRQRDWYLRYRPKLAAPGVPLEHAGCRRYGACSPSCAPSARPRCWNAFWTRTNSCRTTAYGPCRGTISTIPTSSRPATFAPRSNMSRPNRTAISSAEIPIGAGRSGCRSTTCSSKA